MITVIIMVIYIYIYLYTHMILLLYNNIHFFKYNINIVHTKRKCASGDLATSRPTCAKGLASSDMYAVAAVAPAPV